MIIKEIEQNTPEWKTFRRTKIGASDCPAILGKSPFKTAHDVWKEKLFGEEQPRNPSMERGTLLEPEARASAEKRFGVTFKPVVAIHDSMDWMMASLDGLSVDKSVLLEIKCPRETTYKKLSENHEIPEHWIWQIQHALTVTGCAKAILFVYSGNGRSSSIEIKPDISMMNRLVIDESVFWYDYVCQEVPPRPTEDLKILF